LKPPDDEVGFACLCAGCLVEKLGAIRRKGNGMIATGKSATAEFQALPSARMISLIQRCLKNVRSRRPCGGVGIDKCS
jgi:hypothetical protein